MKENINYIYRHYPDDSVYYKYFANSDANEIVPTYDFDDTYTIIETIHWGIYYINLHNIKSFDVKKYDGFKTSLVVFFHDGRTITVVIENDSILRQFKLELILIQNTDATI